MNHQDIINLLGNDWTLYQQLLRRQLKSDIPLLESINDSQLSNTGKQLRPLLTLLTSRAFGTPTHESIAFATATELLHNATLFHDDVADKSSMRRGKPSLSAMIGPTAAVLIGDFWLSRAVTLIVGLPHQSEAIDLFSMVLSRLAEGEMLQMQKASDADTTEQDYFRIIYCKTASLFETACRLAAVSTGAPDSMKEAAGNYGKALGISFQIKDDIMDYQSAEIGKPVGADLQEQKITLPLLGALRSVPESRSGQIRSMVKQIPSHPEFCASIHSFAIENGGLEYANQRLQEYIGLAEEALELFPASPEREVLRELARYNAIRTK